MKCSGCSVRNVLCSFHFVIGSVQCVQCAVFKVQCAVCKHLNMPRKVRSVQKTFYRCTLFCYIIRLFEYSFIQMNKRPCLNELQKEYCVKIN